ncbi:MAG: hypothetical protein WDO73_11915 [Ignavibacteriota bacterium]
MRASAANGPPRKLVVDAGDSEDVAGPPRQYQRIEGIHQYQREQDTSRYCRRDMQG